MFAPSLALLTGLFKAVQDVKSVFNSGRGGVKPIVFLRDDIYDLLTDSDKTKWNDFRLDLDWDLDGIKRLLAFRLSRANDAQSTPLTFEKAWSLAFSSQSIDYGNRQRKYTDIFSYIVKSTHLRPRDFVRYLQACANEAIGSGEEKITPRIVKKMDKAFSNYLKDELVDEIHGVLPEIREVLMVISEIRKQIFSIDEFKTQYEKSVKSGTIKNSNPELALKILFHFSVIGNEPKQKQVNYFRYKNKESRINFNENLIVHRGLFKSLQIL
ncbi:P-loop ATPase, Sll1717 family [Aeromonas salmonicida subsp. pectinolytica]